MKYRIIEVLGLIVAALALLIAAMDSRWIEGLVTNQTLILWIHNVAEYIPYLFLVLQSLTLFFIFKRYEHGLHFRFHRYWILVALLSIFLFVYIPFFAETSFPREILFPYLVALILMIHTLRWYKTHQLQKAYGKDFVKKTPAYTKMLHQLGKTYGEDTIEKIPTYVEMQKQCEDKYGPHFFSHILDIAEPSYIGTEIQHVSSIDLRDRDSNAKEHMQHIMYKIINDSIFSLDEIVKYKLDEANRLPTNLGNSFDFAMETFKRLSNMQGSFAWFINLADPKTWLTDELWRIKYVSPMLKAAKEMREVDIRRIHVLKDTDYQDTEKKKELIQILLKEQLIGIDNKVLKINENVLDNKQKIGVRIGKVFLLDYAIMYSNRMNYLGKIGGKGELLEPKEVQCSDIYPYFYGKASETKIDSGQRKIYILRDVNSFSLFKEHFIFFWHFDEYLKYRTKPEHCHASDAYGSAEFFTRIAKDGSVEIKQFFDLIKDSQIAYSMIDWQDIAEFLAEIKVDENQEIVPLTEKLKVDLRNAFAKLIKDTSGINRDSFNKHFSSIYINEVKLLPYL